MFADIIADPAWSGRWQGSGYDAERATTTTIGSIDSAPDNSRSRTTWVGPRFMPSVIPWTLQGLPTRTRTLPNVKHVRAFYRWVAA